MGGCKIVESILVPCRLKHIPEWVGGSQKPENILVQAKINMCRNLDPDPSPLHHAILKGFACPAKRP